MLTKWNVPIPGPKRVTRREPGTRVTVTTRIQSTLIHYQATRTPIPAGDLACRYCGEWI